MVDWGTAVGEGEILRCRQPYKRGLHTQWEGALARFTPQTSKHRAGREAVGFSSQSAISPGMPCGKAGCISILNSTVKV